MCVSDKNVVRSVLNPIGVSGDRERHSSVARGSLNESQDKIWYGPEVWIRHGFEDLCEHIFDRSDPCRTRSELRNR